MKRASLSAFGIVVAGAALSGIAVQAHHSVAAVYNESKQVTVEGVVMRFQFVDPHPNVRLEVKDRDGKARQWMLEMDNRRELAELGFGTDTLKPGDRIVVTGSRGRSQPHILYIRRLERPSDGFSYQHHQ